MAQLVARREGEANNAGAAAKASNADEASKANTNNKRSDDGVYNIATRIDTMYSSRSMVDESPDRTANNVANPNSKADKNSRNIKRRSNDGMYSIATRINMINFISDVISTIVRKASKNYSFKIIGRKASNIGEASKAADIGMKSCNNDVRSDHGEDDVTTPRCTAIEIPEKKSYETSYNDNDTDVANKAKFNRRNCTDKKRSLIVRYFKVILLVAKKAMMKAAKVRTIREHAMSAANGISKEKKSTQPEGKINMLRKNGVIVEIIEHCTINEAGMATASEVAAAESERVDPERAKTAAALHEMRRPRRRRPGPYPPWRLPREDPSKAAWRAEASQELINEDSGPIVDTS